MIYEYEDSFIIDSIDTEELEKKETESITEIEKMNITDEFYKEKLVKCRVYMLLAREQMENEGMGEKYRIYEKEFNRYLTLSKNNSKIINVSNIPLGRG